MDGSKGGAMKEHHGAFQVAGAFHAAARPLFAGVACRQGRGGPPGLSPFAACGGGSGSSEARLERVAFADLAQGPYFVLALLLDATTLCRTDACCRLLRQLNRASIGPWRALGARVFHGLELEKEGTFEQPVSNLDCDSASSSSRKIARIDWKGRFRHFRVDIPTFCAPFGGPEIAAVAHPDEVAYFRCRLCTDVIDESSTQGVYLEVEVLANPDNLSMAVVDFEVGGCSSVTFSPDTGAVIRERKVREAPRKVEGAYIQPLPSVPPGRRFHGLMGLYLRRGHLAFFRRCIGGTSDGGRDHGPWETTGFVSDLGWAEGRRLTPCLAFRDEGAYHVRVVRVGTEAPFPLEINSGKDGDIRWSVFDWEVGAPTLPAEGADDI
mmetsp:Transcript_100328/g.321710  ORF Transcript_100328/g.321710 Transcript_100328/m.321710 type:complete len:380 (-) Transcript_100328:173-1312(-)